MANGVQQTLKSTGSDDNVTVVRKAAASEIMSIIDREAAGIVTSMPQVARSGEGRPISSKEVVVIINLEKIGADGISNVTVRGVEEAAFQLRPQVRMVQGRSSHGALGKSLWAAVLQSVSWAHRSFSRSNLAATCGARVASSFRWQRL